MKNLYLIEDIQKSDINIIRKDKNAKKIVFDYKSQKVLQSYDIEHQLIDDYFDDTTRKKIFDFSVSCWDWYKNFESPSLKFHKMNLLGIIDRNELHEVLMEIIPKIYVTKKIIQDAQYSDVFVTSKIHRLFTNSNINMNYKLLNKSSIKDVLTHDKIHINYKLGFFTFKIKLDRTRYQWIKKYLEKIICGIYNLRKNSSEKQKIILLEFDPEIYFDLLYEIDKQGYQPVIINFRKSAIWSYNSIKHLKNSHSLVVIPEDLIDKNNLSSIKKMKKDYLKMIKNELGVDEKLSQIFEYEGIVFSDFIKSVLMNVLKDRLEEYMIEILTAESIKKYQNIHSIITLNLSGETEKVFSKKQSKIPIILLQHAFSNYIQKIAYFDVLDDYHLIKNKIAVWGNVVKWYLMDIKSIPENSIIVSGSPKYDSFLPSVKEQRNKKMILVTPRPIINHMEGTRVELYQKYEAVLNKLIDTVENLNDAEIIFKLHPQQNEHNTMINEFLEQKKIDEKLIQFKPVKNLLENCDLHINIAPDNFDASSVILEAMILGCPTLNIKLQRGEINFEFLKDNAVYNVDHDSNFEDVISKLLYDKEKSQELINNAKIHLKRYLSNHGNASKVLIEAIENINNL